jgi:hypothetical protein
MVRIIWRKIPKKDGKAELHCEGDQKLEFELNY